METDNQNLDQYGHRIGQPWTTSELAEAANVSNSRVRQAVMRNEVQSILRTKRLRLVPYYEGIRFIEQREGK